VGKWRHLTDEELRALRALVGAGETPKQSQPKEKKEKNEKMATGDGEANTEQAGDDEEDESEDDEDDEDDDDDDDDDDENEDEDDLMKMWQAERASLAKKNPGATVARGKEPADVR
jgi:hypothetical protein